MHHLLPEAGLHIVGEHYQPVVHHLLAVPGAKLGDIKEAHSHVQALAQCRKWLRENNIKPVIAADTAGAAADIAKLKDKSVASVASELAGQINGLQSLASGIADYTANTTRFVILAKEPRRPQLGSGPCVTTLIFRGAKRAGIALQGTWRLCHQRYQHYKDRELFGRWPFQQGSVPP